MKFNEAKKMQDQLKKFNRQMPILTDIMLTTAVIHSIENFRKQGFDDQSIQKWKPRKRTREKDKGKAILVQSGRLRRSLRKRRVNKLSGYIYSPLIYAKIHNEGGLIDIKPHKRTATRTVRIRGNSGFVNGKFTKGRMKKMTIQGERHNVSGHTFKMPRRRFVGNSINMNNKIHKNLSIKINKIFQ